MRFCLLDRICSLEPEVELTAVKNVSLAEEYLADHFPEFPGAAGRVYAGGRHAGGRVAGADQRELRPQHDRAAGGAKR